MRGWLCAALIAATAAPALADYPVPARTIRAKEIVTSADLVAKPGEAPGALTDPALIVGQEARAALYPGRPIRPGDIGPPAVVDRNDLVTLVYVRGGLRIVTEGRALGRGAVGETIRAMNSASRTTISGQIQADGSIRVE